MNDSIIRAVRARPLIAPMKEPFEIATGARTKVENVLIELKLADGTRGFGECAPLPAFNGETMEGALKAIRSGAQKLLGLDAARFEPLSRKIQSLFPASGAVRAGLEMAALDAWGRQRRLPLWSYFGGSSTTVATDVTVTIVPPAAAAAAAKRITRMGISTIKIKVGRDLDDDVLRVEAVSKAAPKARLIVDANQGYKASGALKLLKRLSSIKIRPVLFEQPVAEQDWAGLAQVAREGGVAVAADETASSLANVLKIAQLKAAHAVNIKLMKFGVRESLEAARAARACGLRLMIGGMVESRLAMACAAHLAAGFGGFEFVDLDTPLWFSRDPMKGGPKIGPGGAYDLSSVAGGIGVQPR